MLEPRFVPIGFEFDMANRTARFQAGDEVQTESAPIGKPVTDEEHRVQVQVPGGFEYQLAEIASAPVLESTGEIRFEHPGGRSSPAMVRLSN